MNKFTLAVAAFAMSAGTSMAATFAPITYESDGNRPSAVDDQSGTATELAGSPIGPGQNIGIAGRIVNAIDTFKFTVNSNWSISFVDLGIDDQVGFDSSDITSPCGGCAGNGDPTRALFSINKEGDEIGDLLSVIVTAKDGGGDPSEGSFNYSGVAGTFILTIDGSINNGDNKGATYDIGISTVPLPAAGWMLIAGMGGLAAMRRRKKAS